MAAQFLRSVQLRLGVYFQSIDTMNAAEQDWLIPPPNLVDLLVSIRVQSWVPSIVPQVPALPLAPVAPPAAPAAPPVGPQLHTHVPPVIPPFVPAGPPATSVLDISHERITNPAVNPEIKAAKEGRYFQLRELFSDTCKGLNPIIKVSQIRRRLR